MNKIYKVIWSKVRNCYVVVSEMAKRNGKCSSSLNKKIIASFLAAGLVAAIIPKDAEAWYIMANNSTIVIAGQGPVYNRVGGSGDRLGTVWGSNTSAEAAWATAFGSNTVASSTNATAFGSNTVASSTNATAFGSNTVASSTNATAWGNGARATGNHATAFGGGTEASNYRATAWGKSTIASGSDSTAWGTETQATKTNATAFGSGTTASSSQATAWGTETTAETGNNVTAFGQYTTASGNNATAFGSRTTASGDTATAWGQRATASGKWSTAFGQDATASGNRSTAFGSGTQATGASSTAFGYLTDASGENATAWGSNTKAVGGGSTAFGAYTEARAENSVAWGNHSIVYGGEVTVGGDVYRDLETLRYNGTNQYYLIGKDANGNIVRLGGRDGDTEIIAGGYTYTPGATGAWEGVDETARGKVDEWITSPAGGNGEVSGQYSTAFGDSSKVYARNALGALGGTVLAGAHNSAAIGVGSDVSSANSYAMGNGATIGENSAGSVALGGQDSDGKLTTIGTGATNSFAAIGGTVGNRATNAIAIGGAVSDSATSAVALGSYSSIGTGATNSFAAIGGTVGNVATNAIAIGGSVSASAVSAIAIGQGSSAVQSRATALGQGATAILENATALGTGATASLKDSVALGSSTTTQAGVVATTGTVGGITYGVWANTLADTNKVVSVGNRQINQVAAGRVSSDSTDAINGSQLYAAYDQLQWNIVTSGNETGTPLNHTIGKLTPTGTRQNLELNAGTGITFNSTAAENDNRIVEIRSNFDTATLGSDGKIESITYFDGTEYVTKEIGGGYGIFDANVGGRKTNQFGSTISVVGEGTKPISEYSGKNVKTVIHQDPSGNSTITVKIDENPSFTSVTTGDTKIDTNGLTISNVGPFGNVTITKTNIAMGGNQIHNVAPGTAGTDAVNLNQLNDVKWNIGTGAVNGGTNKHGGPLDLSPVGKQDGIDRSNIRFNAGAGVDISYSTILTGTSKDDKEIGYNIDISAKFQDATISFDDSGHYIQAITYEGKKYLLAGGGSGTAAPTDVISDNRAVTAELLEHYNEDIKGYEYAIEVESPFMNLNGLKDEKGKPAEIHTDDFAYAKGENAIAIGRQAEAEADNSLAVGHNADAKAENATAIGMNSHAHAENSVSIGVAASSSGNRAIVIGTTASYDSSREDPANATLPHQGSRASGQGSVVLGDHARAQSEIYTLEIAKNLDLIGTPDHLTNDAIAIGTKAEVRATNAIALGGSMSYTDENGVTKYGETNGRYVGAIVGGSAKSGIAIGGAYGEQGENGEIKQEISAAATYGLRGIAIGTGATVANKDDFTALENVLSNPEYQKAKGDFQKARAEYLDKLSTYDAIKDVPLNDPTVPSGMQITQKDKDRAKYQMNEAKAALEEATQTYSLELKKSIRLQEKDAIEESDAIAIGTKAVAQVKESIALGSNSVTTAKDRAGSRTGLSGYDPLQQDSDNDYFRGDEKYKEDDPVWRSTAGSLSVGGGTTTVKDVYGNEKEVTVTRRISNVAAGIEDSDAVNVAQLKRATSLKTDSRNTSIGLDKDGNMVVNSPYLNIQGVKTSSDYTTIINRFGTPEEYIQSLEGQKTEINSRIDSINVSREMIKYSLQKLGEDYKAQKITEAAYLAQMADYEEQLDATGRRLDDLAASLKEKDTEIANAPTHYQEAKEYYDSQANASGTDSIAVGNKSVAGGKESVSIGANNTIGTPGELNAKPDAELEKEGQKSIAIGSGNTVMGKKSMAIGTDNTVTGDRSGAIGDPNVIDASDSYSVGNDNKIAAGQNNVFALGNQVTTTTSNSVFLGSNSAYVADGKTTAGMSEYSSATINGRTYNYAGGKPAGVVSVGDEGKERRIQNVAAGKVSADSTDAINGSQLYSALDNVNNSFTNLGDQISNVDNRTRKGIAGAAALAALHPMEFDPDDKLTFAAGMGHYRGETAAALGLFYRADEKVMFSLGGTVGNGENMVNAGVSFSLDRTPRVTGSRTALTKEVVQLREHVAKQDAQIAELTALVRQLAGNAGLQVPASSALPTEGPALFADNLDNKWVYDAIEDLEQRGYFNGYAGRALTRQQIAAALDMAMSGGAKLDERIVKEFEPELSHVRVAHVEGKGNNEGEWYERPRASHDKYEDKHKIEKKPFRVEEKKVTSKS